MTRWTLEIRGLSTFSASTLQKAIGTGLEIWSLGWILYQRCPLPHSRHSTLVVGAATLLMVLQY